MDTYITKIKPFNNLNGLASILINNLYYDLQEHQFIINNKCNLENIKWLGRDCPTKIGKDIICRNISESTLSFSFGTNKGIQKTVCLARRYSPHNWGHLLCETAIPIEYIYNLINVNERSNRVIVFDDDSLEENSIYWFEGYNELRIKQCDSHSKNIFSPMSDDIIFGFKKYINNYNFENTRYLRIENPIIHGIGQISPWCIGVKWNDKLMSKILDKYVTDAYNFYYPELNIKTINQNTLTFIIKEGRRSVLNWKDVSILFRKIAKDNNLLYEEFNLENTSYLKQLEILSRTKILFTNGGSSSFCSFLLPKLTNVLYFPIYGNRFESNLFKNFKHRFNFYDYEEYDKNWKKNVITANKSYNVNISILENIAKKIINEK